MSDPVVSIVMPVYNREGSVGRAVDSLVEQTFRDLELIVVDDGSTDDTLCVFKGADAPA
jgi:glycosyltransferase involved in cell wall biosynthesis